MDYKEKLAALPQPPADAPFRLKEIVSVNFKPHCYTIGTRHVAVAADHHGGMLGDYAIEDAERRGAHCAHPGCQVRYRDHTYDVVCVVELDGGGDKIADVPGLHDYLKSTVDKAKELKIDGFAFQRAQR